MHGSSPLVLVLFLIALVLSMIWIVRDANQRGKDGLIVGLIAFFAWPISILFWIAVRPEEKVEIRRCPVCGAPLNRKSGNCPNCYDGQ